MTDLLAYREYKALAVIMLLIAQELTEIARLNATLQRLRNSLIAVINSPMVAIFFVWMLLKVVAIIGEP